MKIVFTKSPTGAPHLLAYNVDDVADLPDDVAKEMIKEGFAIDLKNLQQPAKDVAAPVSEKATKKRRRIRKAIKK